ncbi:MAG: response regulator [Acidobacteriota bacterium]|nr:response regulator [Acidobacteriota bacterium]MDH3523388.1 response regulator [Acidobacteriota bacterium]
MAVDPLVLVVDDEPAVRRLVASQVSQIGYQAEALADAAAALSFVRAESGRIALVLTDVDMPGTSGVELLGSIKSTDDSIQVVMVTGMQDLGTVRNCLRRGAYDYLVKPFEFEELRNTVERAVERFHLLRETRRYQARLEQMVEVRTRELRETRDIALLAMGKLAESRDPEIGRHLERISAFAGRLSRCLAQGGRLEVDELFIEQIEISSALHDIGKVAVPDEILLKPGALDEEETAVMRTHTTIGGDTLRQIIERYEGHDYLTMAMEIAYSHHERWDGKGYPKGLSGDRIPISARIVAACDAYDAITSVRPYKRALSHEEALRRIAADSGSHFDPAVAEALATCADDFRAIARRLHDGTASLTAAPG